MPICEGPIGISNRNRYGTEAIGMIDLAIHPTEAVLEDLLVLMECVGADETWIKQVFVDQSERDLSRQYHISPDE